MFLNTDMELVYDIDTDNSGASGTSCTMSSSQTDSTVDYCSESDMRSTVKTYAEVSLYSNFKWLKYKILFEIFSIIHMFKQFVG